MSKSASEDRVWMYQEQYSHAQTFTFVYKGDLVFWVTIFVTWDGATLEFESFNRIAEGIIMLAWHKQQIES